MTIFIMALWLVIAFSLYGHQYWKNFAERRLWEEEKYQLELGVNELGESYEAELLDRDEKIYRMIAERTVQDAELEHRDKIIEHHASKCHGLIEDSMELIMDRLEQMHPTEEAEKTSP